MSEKYDKYELKMTLFDNGILEEFLLFQRNYKPTLEFTGTLTEGEK